MFEIKSITPSIELFDNWLTEFRHNINLKVFIKFVEHELFILQSSHIILYKDGFLHKQDKINVKCY